MLKTDNVSRERIFATFRGEAVDRFPVWLKMTNRTWQSSQPEPYRSMDAESLLRETGCDLMLGCGVGARSHNPHVEYESHRENGSRRTVMKTPDGTLTAEESLDRYTNSWHPTRFAVNTVEELAAARWLYTDTTYTVDEGAAAQAAQRQRELETRDVVTTAGTGPSPLMQMIEHVSGPVNSIYLLADAPELFGELTELMHGDKLRQLRATIPHTPADTFWLTENTSTTLISPALFREFCVPQLSEYASIAQECGMIAVHHMCGTLNALLEDIDEMPAKVNEAFTTRPVGDCSLAEGRRRMPSKALIGGTNATLWLSSPEAIVDEVANDLAACPDRRKIFLTSAGVLPPPVSFEKAKEVTAAFKRLRP